MIRLAALIRLVVIAAIVIVPTWLTFIWIRRFMFVLTAGAFLNEVASTMVAAVLAAFVFTAALGIAREVLP